jgi:hypothetical protein
MATGVRGALQRHARGAAALLAAVLLGVLGVLGLDGAPVAAAAAGPPAIGGNGTVSVSRYSLQPVRYSGTRLVAFGLVALILVGYFVLRRWLVRRRQMARAEPGARVAPGPGQAIR